MKKNLLAILIASLGYCLTLGAIAAEEKGPPPAETKARSAAEARILQEFSKTKTTESLYAFARRPTRLAQKDCELCSYFPATQPSVDAVTKIETMADAVKKIETMSDVSLKAQFFQLLVNNHPQFPPRLSAKNGEEKGILPNLSKFEAKFLGEGGFGSVARFHFSDIGISETGADMVIKRISLEKKARARHIFKEISALSHFNGLGILPDFYGAFCDGIEVFLAMEALEGDVLSVKRHATQAALAGISKSRGEIFKIGRAKRKQLVNAVALFHMGGWIHRDIKPANVLLRKIPRRTFLDKLGGAFAQTRTIVLGDVGLASPKTAPFGIAGSTFILDPSYFDSDNWSSGHVNEGEYLGHKETEEKVVGLEKIDAFGLGVTLYDAKADEYDSPGDPFTPAEVFFVKIVGKQSLEVREEVEDKDAAYRKIWNIYTTYARTLQKAIAVGQGSNRNRPERWDQESKWISQLLEPDRRNRMSVRELQANYAGYYPED